MLNRVFHSEFTPFYGKVFEEKKIDNYTFLIDFFEGMHKVVRRHYRQTPQIAIILLMISLSSCSQNQNNDWESIFAKHHIRGTFVLKDLTDNKVKMYSSARSDSAYLPASTFKILNSLIALQTSVINTIHDTIQWDGIDKGWEPWNKDQNMETAMPISCVWFYQELARRIGRERMQNWLEKVEYGNTKLGKEIDTFWLEGDLRISAIEQIEFLERLINSTLPFDPKIQEIVKRIMITDSTNEYIIHSKTGWTSNIGWDVGYIETKNRRLVFAMNMDIFQKQNAKYRKQITYEILQTEQIIPASWKPKP